MFCCINVNKDVNLHYLAFATNDLKVNFNTTALVTVTAKIMVSVV